METFDLINIYRARHPNSRLFSCESKFLQVFLVAKSLVKYVSKVGITVLIAPDHKAIYFYVVACDDLKGLLFLEIQQYLA